MSKDIMKTWSPQEFQDMQRKNINKYLDYRDKAISNTAQQMLYLSLISRGIETKIDISKSPKENLIEINSVMKKMDWRFKVSKCNKFGGNKVELYWACNGKSIKIVNVKDPEIVLISNKSK